MRVANKAVDALESLYNTDYGVGSPAVILCKSSMSRCIHESRHHAILARL